MYKVVAVILIGITILTAEYLHFCNKYYTIEMTKDDYRLIIKGKPDQRAKLAAGIFTLMAMDILAILGWLTYDNQRKKL